MKIGAYYYPEQWPRHQWERDFDNFAKLGLQIIHMAEFAWFSLEPRPGEFEFGWLDQCMELSRQRGLDVILCTPTAAPPIWLTDEHPDVLPVDEYGRRARHGGRRHYSPLSPHMREASVRIVTAMAQRYGNHPSIIGWQIDNEYGGGFDQNDHAHEAFRQWLQRKYGTIDQLNDAWGNQFWNQHYTSFSQILFPRTRDPIYGNPHQHLDASRFWSWAWADFNRLQARILKQHVGERFITTNFMSLFLDCDPLDMVEDLSLFSWDCYPVTGWDKDVKDQTFRMADPAAIGIVHDHMASFNGRWAQMELQPGQINWSGVPVLPYPGAIRLWVWTAFAHGAEFVTTYRYRQPRFGIEMFHHGLVRTDGVTLSRGGEEFAQTIQEMKRLAPSRPEGEGGGEREAGEDETVGLVLDFDQLWYFKTLAQSRRWDAIAFIKMWYAAVMRLGLRVKILHPRRAWPAGLKLVIAPALQMVDDALVKQFTDHVARGGHLLLTCRTGLMDRNGQLWEGPTARPILSLTGARIDEYDVMPDDAVAHVEIDGKRFEWSVWGDLLTPEAGTEVVARYTDQFYAGAAAVTRKQHEGQGTVTYCGVYPQAEFAHLLVEQAARHAKMAITTLPPRVHVLKRGRYKVLLNYHDQSVEAPVSPHAKFIVGGRQVGPADVAVWEDA